MILTLLQNGDYETARTQALTELKTTPITQNFIIMQHGRTMHSVKKMLQSLYEKALQLGLPADSRKEAYIGLGSTYRITGQPENLSAFSKQLYKNFQIIMPCVLFQ